MDNSDLWIQAYNEMKNGGELNKNTRQNRFESGQPTFDYCMDEIGVFPPEALFMGMADDNLPVLLNVHDPIPQNVLFVGDEGTGKTSALQVMAKFIETQQSSRDMQFAVLSNHIDEWEGVGETKHCAGKFAMYDRGAEEMILSLASWASGNRNNKQSVILLLDDLEYAICNLEFDAKQNLRWLIQKGANRKVWAVATISSKSVKNTEAWVEQFKTKIFSNIKDSSLWDLVGVNGKVFSLVQNQMVLLENGNWLKFWIPSL